MSTPLYQAVKEHAERNPISLHVPGHKNGVLLQQNSFFTDMLNIDVTELTNLDDLHCPEGVILEAQRLLKDAYKVRQSYFLVNGSTVGNLAMLMATIHEGETVFVQRNCHKSILNGIQLTRAQPILLGPEDNEEWGVAGGVSLETIKEAYALYPHCKAIVLTYPNYYGMTFELKEIVQFAHSKGIPVLIDEAHGAHFKGGDFFPPSAIEFGADVVVQSAHKTLPAMTMGAYLHINSPFISPEMIERYLRILQSSSPSYPIMASLDIARKYIATYSKEDEEYLKVAIDEFKMKLRTIREIKVLDYPAKSGDPLKLTLQSQCGYSGYELQRLFEEKGVFTEMADPRNVLLVLPLLKKGMAFPFNDIVNKMKEALNERSIPAKEEAKEYNYFRKEKISTINMIQTQTTELVPYREAVNRVCAESIIPYPPGVPFLLSGENITVEDTEGLTVLLKSGARFQGGENLIKGNIKVFCKLEDT